MPTIDVPSEAVRVAAASLGAPDDGYTDAAWKATLTRGVVRDALAATVPNLYGTLRVTHPTTVAITDAIDSTNRLRSSVADALMLLEMGDAPAAEATLRAALARDPIPT